MAKKIMEPIHPGELLLEEFLEPMGLSQYRLAKGLSVAPRRINEIACRSDSSDNGDVDSTWTYPALAAP